MSHSFSTYHPVSEQGTRHAHPRASAAAISRHVQRSHKGYTLTHAGHQIRIGPVAFWIVVGALVVMGVWSIATGTYFAFRENVLTRLIGRQAEMQFAYEDRIAELRAQVDRVMSRQLLDQEQFEQKLNTLLQRQTTLEQRTKALGGESLATGTVKPFEMELWYISGDPQSVIQEQVTNGLAVRMAVLALIHRHIRGSQGAAV